MMHSDSSIARDYKGPNSAMAQRLWARAGWLFGLCVLLGGMVLPVKASLGGLAASVTQDQTQLQGQALQITTQERFTRFEFTTPAGVRVRQFVAPSGLVFALSWQGPTMPDLQTLLANQYPLYLEAAAAPRLSRRSLAIDNDSLVLHIMAMPRGFFGTAHLPNQLPPGVVLTELR